MSKDTEALDTAIYLRTLTLWRIRRAGRVPVITKLAYPHCSGSHNLEEASKGTLKKGNTLCLLATKPIIE